MRYVLSDLCRRDRWLAGRVEGLFGNASGDEDEGEDEETNGRHEETAQNSNKFLPKKRAFN